MSIKSIARIFSLGEASEPTQDVPLSPEQREQFRQFAMRSVSEDERFEAEQRAKAAAEEEYRNSFDGRTEVYREGQLNRAGFAGGSEP